MDGGGEECVGGEDSSQAAGTLCRGRGRCRCSWGGGCEWHVGYETGQEDFQRVDRSRCGE